ncbi:MAG: hypothetical protein IPG99_13980 [Ignavibacteria bacterium]|nr:hypothetical protein [Ignavibacteria bacterium]
MRLTQYFVPTLKDDPVDAVVASHRLMIRSGMIRPLTSGCLLLFAAWSKDVPES